MEKLYFKNPQELVDFIMEVTKEMKFITINNITFYLKNCEINFTDNYIDIRDNNLNIICCMRIDKITKINEYKIIKEWD